MDPPPELRLRGRRGEEGTTSSAQFAEFIAQTPYSAGTREGLLKLFTEDRDWMPGVPTAEKVEQLKKMSYIDFVSNVVKIHRDAVANILSVGGTGGTNQTAGPDTYRRLVCLAARRARVHRDGPPRPPRSCQTWSKTRG